MKTIAMSGRREDVLLGIQMLKDKFGSKITIEELIDEIENDS